MENRQDYIKKIALEFCERAPWKDDPEFKGTILGVSGERVLVKKIGGEFTARIVTDLVRIVSKGWYYELWVNGVNVARYNTTRECDKRAVELIEEFNL